MKKQEYSLSAYIDSLTTEDLIWAYQAGQKNKRDRIELAREGLEMYIVKNMSELLRYKDKIKDQEEIDILNESISSELHDLFDLYFVS